MTNYYKFGFHAGPGGNLTGIGDYFRSLATAKVPIFFKSADNYGPIDELLRTFNPYTTAVFRLTTAGQNDGYDYDVPDYTQSPDVAARNHWNAIRAKLPQEFNKSVWIEPINEVDKNKADWLGWFAINIVELAGREGYKLALFGWASGEPEIADWETEGVLEFLRMCAENPTTCAISIHEYSYTIDEIDNGYPYLVGRFFMINEVCTRHGIGLPTILITEFGWTYNNIPPADTAVAHLDWAQLIYEPHDNILGVSIWYLGSGFGGIANKVNALIPIVGEKSVSYAYQPPSEIPPAEVKHTIHLLPQNTTLDELHAVTDYLHPTRSAFTYSADVVHKLLYHAVSGSKCAVWDGERWPDNIFTWLTARNITYEKRYFSQLNNPPDPPTPPQTSNPLLGLHGTADPGAYPNGERELFTTSRSQIIKVLSAANPSLVRDMALDNHTAPFIIRAFLHVGGRVITPQQFVSDTINDIDRTINYIQPQRPIWIEIHNEPNLYAEGLGTSWATPQHFNAWFLECLSLYKMQLPQTIKYLFPGLSPNPTIPNVSWDSMDFIRKCATAVNAADSLGVHAYWSSEPGTQYPMGTAVAVVQYYQNLFPNKKLFVTEASNNRPASSTDKGLQYIEFIRQLRAVPNVIGVTYFVSSASYGFNDEIWLGRGIADIVGARQ